MPQLTRPVAFNGLIGRGLLSQGGRDCAAVISPHRLMTFLSAAALCALAAIPVCAQTDTPLPAQRWRVSAGAFFATNLPSGVSSDTGFSVAASNDVVTLTGGGVVSLGLRYSQYHAEGGQRLELTSPTVEYRYKFDEQGTKPSAWYLAGGAGMVFSHNSAGANGKHFAYTAAAGYDCARTFYEARFVAGTKRGENGIIASVGVKF